MIHELKTEAIYFDAIVDKRKTFELRRNDRNFQIGHILHLRKLTSDCQYYTGEECLVKVTYMLSGGKFGLEEGYCIMGIEFLTNTYQ